jgi:transcription antitermination factor NusG
MLAAQWFVVRTNPQKESLVEARLKHLETYLPRFKTSSGRIAPLFPQYIFASIIAEWGSIKSTIGVRALLMAGDHPAVVSGDVIASWKAKERGGLVVLPPPPRFQPGERLTILRGSLKSRTVIHAGMSGKDRERVLIEMLGQRVSILVPSVDLVPEIRQPTRNGLRRQRETFTAQRAVSSEGRSIRSF